MITKAKSEAKVSSRRNGVSALWALWAALFLWGIHAPVGRYLALHQEPILAVMAARFWIGTAVFWLFLAAFGRLDLSLLRRHFGRVFFLSFVGIFLNSLVFHLGMYYVSGTLVMLLENLAPLFVVFLVYVIDGKKPSLFQLACLLVSFGGLALIVLAKLAEGGAGAGLAQSRDFLLGVALEVAAGLTFGVYIYFSSRWLKGMVLPETPREGRGEALSAIINFLFALFLLAALLGTPFLFEFRAGDLAPDRLVMIAELGVFQSGIAYILWNVAQAALPVSLTSIAFYLTVVFTTINEVVFMGLKLNAALVTGAALILAGVIALSRPTSARSSHL